MRTPTTKLSWITCPVVCADPSHTVRISLDSDSKIRTIATDCDRNDLDIANALGTACCRKFVNLFAEYVHTADYDARSRAQRECKELLTGSRHIVDIIRYVMQDARDTHAERPQRAAVSAVYVPRFAHMSVGDKIFEFNKAIKQLPEFSEWAEFRLVRSWESNTWAELTIDGQTVASMWLSPGQRTTAYVRSADRFKLPALTAVRTAGTRKTTICRLCGRCSGRGHNEKPEHANRLRDLTCRLLNRFGFEVKS